MSRTIVTKERKDPNTRDFFPTPEWCSRSLYKVVPFLPVPTLDAGCGTGNLMAGICQALGTYLPIGGIERDPNLAKIAYDRGFDVEVGDALSISWEDEVVISNPPFSNMWNFLQKGVLEAECFILLASLSLLASKTRQEFLKQNRPDTIVVMSQRPKFTVNKDGKLATDFADYAWFIWYKGLVYEGTKFYFITEED